MGGSLEYGDEATIFWPDVSFDNDIRNLHAVGVCEDEDFRKVQGRRLAGRDRIPRHGNASSYKEKAYDWCCSH